MVPRGLERPAKEPEVPEVEEEPVEATDDDVNVDAIEDVAKEESPVDDAIEDVDKEEGSDGNYTDDDAMEENLLHLGDSTHQVSFKDGGKFPELRRAAGPGLSAREEASNPQVEKICHALLLPPLNL